MPNIFVLLISPPWFRSTWPLKCLYFALLIWCNSGHWYERDICWRNLEKVFLLKEGLQKAIVLPWKPVSWPHVMNVTAILGPEVALAYGEQMEENTGQKYESNLSLQIHCRVAELTNPRPALALEFLLCCITNVLFFKPLWVTCSLLSVVDTRVNIFLF